MMTCPVCGKISVVEFKTNEADILRCPECHHCFSHVHKNNEHIQYSDEYYSDDHKNWFENPNYSLFEKIYKIISADNRKIAVLDIGCGKCDFLKYLNEKNSTFTLTGIDLCENIPIEGINFINGDFFTTDFDRQFDVVVSLATIEHIQNVRSFIKKAYDVCKPGGLMIHMTVNENGMIYQFSRIMKRINLSRAYDRLYSSHHLNHFNILSLRKLLEQSGLKTLKTIRHNFPLKAVDTGSSSLFSHYLTLSYIAFIFGVSKIIGKTYLQTIVCRK